MLLNYIKYRLEFEIQSWLINPKLSQLLELLYLFNDFIIRDYPRIGLGEEVQKIWSIDWASNISFKDIRRTNDISYFENEFNQPENNKIKQENIYWHEWFGKNQWHDLAIENIKLFVAKFNQFNELSNIDYHISGPWLEFIETDNYIRDREEERDIKNFKLIPLRNGGIMRILIQWILMLFKGTVLKMTLKSTPQLLTYLSSRLNEAEESKNSILREFDLNQIPECSDRNIWVMFKLLNDIWFWKKMDTSSNWSFIEANFIETNENCNAFYLSRCCQSQSIPNDIYSLFFDKEQWKLLSTKTCDKDCLAHNEVKAKGILLNEICLILWDLFSKGTDNEHNLSQNLSSSYSESEVSCLLKLYRTYPVVIQTTIISECLWNNLWGWCEDDTRRTIGHDFSKELVYFIVQEWWDKSNNLKQRDDHSEDENIRLQNISDECEKYYDLIKSLKNLPSKISNPMKELSSIISIVPK